MRVLSPGRLLAAALLAAGLTTAAASATETLRLLSPGEGARLEAGSQATLEWAPAAGLRSHWEEWEAFLSLDGGRTYPFRLTQHLDRDLRRVTFKVPDLPTREARILLRVGDEREELGIELPQRFTITASLPGSPRTLALPKQVWRRGEPARPGEPGVLSWIEGPRHGGPQREVVAEEPAQAVPGLSLPPQAPELAAVAARVSPSGAPAVEPQARTIPSPPPAARANARVPLAQTADIRLLIKRQNE